MSVTGVELVLMGAGAFAPSLLDRRQAGRWTSSTYPRLLIKNAFDRIAALIGLVVLFPFLLVIGLAVRVDSPGPALYRQERVGRNGQTFRIWKYRTMFVGADYHLPRLLQRHGRDGVPLFKVPDDPRITRLGRLLRRTSIDELPQIFNVLAGQMSLVGPRPQRPAEVALYSPRERSRLHVKPGLTGLWQVSGRSALDWKEAVEYDLRYVREWSLSLDVKILVRTVRVVLRGDGAV